MDKKLVLIWFIIIGCFACEVKNQPEAKQNTSLKKSSKREHVLKKTATNSSIPNQIKNRKKEGFWKEFYKNGQLKTEGTYISGLKEGLHKEWWENGQLAVAGNFKNGKENGHMKFVHDNGHLVGEGNFKNGERIGIWKFYNFDTGLLEVKGNWKAGKQDGLWKYYYQSGLLEKEEIFKDNKVITRKCWNEKGTELACK